MKGLDYNDKEPFESRGKWLHIGPVCASYNYNLS